VDFFITNIVENRHPRGVRNIFSFFGF